MGTIRWKDVLVFKSPNRVDWLMTNLKLAEVIQSLNPGASASELAMIASSTGRHMKKRVMRYGVRKVYVALLREED